MLRGCFALCLPLVLNFLVLFLVFIHLLSLAFLLLFDFSTALVNRRALRICWKGAGTSVYREEG